MDISCSYFRAHAQENKRRNCHVPEEEHRHHLDADDGCGHARRLFDDDRDAGHLSGSHVGDAAPADGGEEQPAEEVVERDPATFSLLYMSSATTTVDPWLDTPVGQWLQEKTNVELEIEYLVGSDVRQKASLLIAAGEYPDIMNTSDASGDLYAAGAFIPAQ